MISELCSRIIHSNLRGSTGEAVELYRSVCAPFQVRLNSETFFCFVSVRGCDPEVGGYPSKDLPNFAVILQVLNTKQLYCNSNDIRATPGHNLGRFRGGYIGTRSNVDWSHGPLL